MPIDRRAFSTLKLLRTDRYVLTEVILNFIGATVFSLFILLMFQALRLAEFLIVHSVSPVLLGKLALFMGMSLMPLVLPLAFLMAILVSFSRLSVDSELIALKANGIGMVRIAVPVFILSLAVAALSLLLNTFWVPWGETAFKKTEIKIRNTKAVSAIKEGAFNSGFFDLLLFADKVDSRTNKMKKVFIFDEREAQKPLAYVSKEASIIPVKTGNEFGTAVLLELYSGSTHHQDLETKTYEKLDFEKYRLFLKIDEGADTTLQKPHMISQSHLLELIEKYPVSQFEGREFRGEYWRRIDTSLTPIIFVFLGIGFGTVRYRAAKTGAVLTGFVILILYWTLQTAGTFAVQKGSLAPFWAMQMPNMILFVAGLWTFRRTTW